MIEAKDEDSNSESGNELKEDLNAAGLDYDAASISELQLEEKIKQVKKHEDKFSRNEWFQF